MRKLSLKLLPMTTAVLIALLFSQVGWAKATGSPPTWWVHNALCIHSYEGSWTDPNGPYYGGMQMDIGFQTTYGYWAYRRWGTADHWPVWAQLQVAYQGWKSRGWYPWPNTARYCNLL